MGLDRKERDRRKMEYIRRKHSGRKFFDITPTPLWEEVLMFNNNDSKPKKIIKV